MAVFWASLYLFLSTRKMNLFNVFYPFFASWPWLRALVLLFPISFLFCENAIFYFYQLHVIVLPYKPLFSYKSILFSLIKYIHFIK